jgi:hypothetical protein
MPETRLGNRPVKTIGYKYPELRFPELRYGMKPVEEEGEVEE